MTELRIPLDTRALNELGVWVPIPAIAAYQEQRLKLEAARKARDSQERTDLAKSQTGEDDELA